MITSAQNPKIKQVRALLASGKDRDTSGLFVVEGVRLMEEVMAANLQTELVLFSSQLSPRGKILLDQFQKRHIPLEEVSADLLERISDTRTSQGILIILKIPHLYVPLNRDLVLALDGISDPGNLGTILRSAHAVGIQAVFLTPGSTDAFAPKVVRAGMGVHFHLPIQTMKAEAIAGFCQQEPSLSIFLAEASIGQVCWEADLSQPLCLVIGSEAHGAGEEIRKLAHQRIRIPMHGGTESYNAAVAAGILIYEIYRQRNTK